jgi:hypothetical protein
VTFNNRGDWSLYATYNPGDFVIYGQGTYVAMYTHHGFQPGSIQGPWVGAPSFGQVFPTNTITTTNSSTCIIGELHVFPYQLLNGQWVPADGRLLQIAQYPALFDVIGAQFGGDGHVSFGVPDYRAISPNGSEYHICITGYFP